MGVLGSIFQSAGKAIPECAVKIQPEFFYVPAHRTLYIELCDTWDTGKAIDLIDFTQRLRDKNILESLGGAAAVTHLAADYVPTAANIEYYLDIMRDKYVLREAIAAATELVRRAYQPGADDEGEPAALLDEHESKLASIRSLHGHNGAFTLEDAATEIAKPIDTPPDVIEGVLHQGGKASFGGASKSRKTWLLLDIAVSVASGAPWFAGFPTRKGRVLYVNFELPKAFCWKRIRAICGERQITVEPGMLTVWNLRGRVRDWPRLQQQIRPEEYSLITIDPVYKLLLLVGESIRDENRTGGVATVLDQLDALDERKGAAL